MALKQTVLVIDDEFGVRAALRAILQKDFAVVPCADGPAAIRYTSDHPGEVRVAFVDHGMPDMDGNAVCASLRAIDPCIALIGFSGNEGASFDGAMFAHVRKRQTTPDGLLELTRRAAKAVNLAKNP